MKDALEEALILSHSWVNTPSLLIAHRPSFLFRTIKDLVAEILLNIGSLYKASEAVRSSVEW